MGLPYGFKAKSNRVALGYRKDLGLAPQDPLDFYALSVLLGIPIVRLSTFSTSHTIEVRQLTRVEPNAFSAVLIPIGAGQSIILVNDSHSIGRQNNSIGHELSHVILLHPPSYSFGEAAITELSNYDRGIEGEANCLASYLLITDEAAWYIVTSNMPSIKACRIYGVSNPMLQYRLNASGARKRMARAAAKTG